MSRIIKSRSSGIKNEGKVIGIKDFSSINIEESILDDSIEIEKRKFLDYYQKQAEEILIKAQEDADNIRKEIMTEQSSWDEEKRRLIALAREEGFKQGYEEGKMQGYNEYQLQIEKANQITNEMKEEFIRHIEASEKVILDLGMKAAEKILQVTLNNDPESFNSLVKQVVKEVRNAKEVHIYIHPDQFNFVLQSKDELDALLPINQQCYLYTNDQLHSFQCLIETTSGRIDASIDSQLSELKMKLMEIIEGVES